MKNLISLVIPGNNNNKIIPPDNIPTLAPSGPTSPGGIFGWIISLLLIGVTFLALSYLIFGGLMWITSQGDKQKIESARKTITFAILGLILALLSVLIVRVIGMMLGADLLGSTL